ncbi:anti-sigma factor domain-containing protein [Alkalihalobacillus sp. CinArs1]|uniref:anti-sigma factor domain-containing protein n=1 Tax=Alkalihalobacillus sp. CinArs1 TaxID=2995314 RepID=UPI0022DE1825|nr:anti-sigma factor domain-containing protein [Alkalihalobacillus sp. CinArs1]
MKNGVIMEIRGRKAVVLTPEGEFTTIFLKRNHNLSIGSEIKLAKKPEKNKKGFFIPSMPTMAGMATIIMLFVIVASVIPVPNNDAVAAYVSFDINPSIEVGVNSDLEVVQYQAWNSDGEGLSLDKDTKNMPLAEFANVLISKLEENGFLTDQGKLLIVASNVEENSRYQKVKSKLEETINGLKNNEVLTKQAVAITTILHADHHTRKLAVEKGVSPGKYITYLAAQDRGVTISLEDARDLSIKKLDSLENRETASEGNTEPVEDRNDLDNKITQLNDKSNKAVDSSENKKGQSNQNSEAVVKEEKDPIGQLSNKNEKSSSQPTGNNDSGRVDKDSEQNGDNNEKNSGSSINDKPKDDKEVREDKEDREKDDEDEDEEDEQDEREDNRSKEDNDD